MKVFSTASLSTAVLALAALHSTRAQSTTGSAGTVTAASGATGSSSTATTSTTTSTSSGSAANDFMSSLSAGSSSGATAAAADSYHFSPVHVVQARVQSDEPVWNEEGQRFVSTYYDTLQDAYVGLMDTVNTASVEGALMYVQAEGINYDTRSTEERCTRKNEMTYVVFYEFAIAQTNETLALYEDTADQNEYGTMLAMDSGRCTPSSTTSSGGEVFPEACYYFNGDDGQPEIGPFVGGTLKATDPRAPYPNNVWYSFPNTCPLEEWSDKTTECRASTRLGLCDMNVLPDGVSCTFAYRVLGFILIDDLVGITSMVSNTTGETYANFSEFCEDGGVEFEASDAGEWIDGIAFWDNPQDETANSERATKLVEAYYNLTNGLITTSGLDDTTIAHMLPLPTPSELAAENPPCYMNVKKCNTDYGCKRELYGNTCTVCNSTADGCEAPPSDWTFPTLTKAVGDNGGTGDASSDSSSAGTSSSAGAAGASGSSDARMNAVSAVLATSLLALASVFLN
ncbi:hypothetical protein BBJ28_00006502 [Nothophytophthora sp. Chile5]|nr:hypothetical protein BBJ28_00006502 [Nothophytophthora sp. Chile5]